MNTIRINPNSPCAQKFNKEHAAQAGQRVSRKLRSRIADYKSMIAKPRSDGWVGYHQPGSQK